jgi:hypothetical protein
MTGFKLGTSYTVSGSIVVVVCKFWEVYFYSRIGLDPNSENFSLIHFITGFELRLFLIQHSMDLHKWKISI